MAYRLIVPKPVQKQIEKLPRDIMASIIRKADGLAEEPRPIGSRKLKGLHNEYRIRVGDYRLRYEIDDKQRIVFLLHCRHRREVYEF